MGASLRILMIYQGESLIGEWYYRVIGRQNRRMVKTKGMGFFKGVLLVPNLKKNLLSIGVI